MGRGSLMLMAVTWGGLAVLALLLIEPIVVRLPRARPVSIAAPAALAATADATGQPSPSFDRVRLTDGTF